MIYDLIIQVWFNHIQIMILSYKYAQTVITTTNNHFQT